MMVDSAHSTIQPGSSTDTDTDTDTNADTSTGTNTDTDNSDEEDTNPTKMMGFTQRVTSEVRLIF
jgi:hypothetical protein